MAAAKKKRPRRPADMSGAVEPSVRTFTAWTTELLRQAQVQADSGNLRTVANLCEWILGDDRVAPTLNTRIHALFGLEPTFEASGDKRRANRAMKALDAGEDWWAAYPESEASQIVRWGLLLGVGPARHAWEKLDGHGGRVLPMPEFWHPQHFRQDQNTKQWFTRIAARGTAQSGGLEIPIDPGEGEWILHTPFGKNRPWSMGLWRALAPLVLLKAFAQQDWAQISERSIILVLTCLDTNADAAKQFQGWTKEARQELATNIYSRGRNAVAALPPGIDLKAVQSAVRAKDVQGALIEMADTAITIVIRGGNLTTEVKEGSRAATETQAETGDLGNLRFDAQAWTTTAHDQSLVYWAEFNYGDRNLAPWPVYPVEPEEDLRQKVETEEKAFGNVDTAEKLGFAVDREDFLEQHKITWAKPGERPPEPEPIAPAEPGEEPEAGDEPEPPAEPENRLASGFDTRAAKGFVEGQSYADALTARGAERTSESLVGLLERVGTMLDGVDDFETARKRLLELYDNEPDPEELADRANKLLILAQLGGVVAVRKDVPELDEDAG